MQIYANMPDVLKAKVDNFTPLQRRYAEHRAKGLTQAQAIRNAGSIADPKNMASLGYQIEQMDGVKEYILFMQNEKSKICPVDELELIAMLRTIYTLALDKGLLKDANKTVELMGNMIGHFGKGAAKPLEGSKTTSEAFHEEDSDDGEEGSRADRVKRLLDSLNKA